MCTESTVEDEDGMGIPAPEGRDVQMGGVLG